MKQTHNNHAFVVAELLRFWESQEKASSKWHKETLEMWRQNAKSGACHKAYQEVINKLEEK